MVTGYSNFPKEDIEKLVGIITNPAGGRQFKSVMDYRKLKLPCYAIVPIISDITSEFFGYAYAKYTIPLENKCTLRFLIFSPEETQIQLLQDSETLEVTVDIDIVG